MRVPSLGTQAGLRFVVDQIRAFEETGSHTFLFGYEESFGYLGATFVCDKDAVMAAYHKADDRTLYDAAHLGPVRALP